MMAAKLSRRFFPRLRVERLNFRISDVRDADGLPIRLRVHYRDLGEAIDDVRREADFRSLERWSAPQNRLSKYLVKSLAIASFDDRQTLWRALFVVQVANWWQRQNHAEDNGRVFLESRAWFGAIERYARKGRLPVAAVPRTIEWKSLPVHLLGARGMWLARAVRNSLSGYGSGADQTTDRIRLMTDYWGYFNLDRPECYSDFFFAQASPFPADRLLVTFSMPGDPVSEERSAKLGRLGIRAMALNPLARTARSVPLYTYWPSFRTSWKSPRFRSAVDSQWASKCVRDYQLRTGYWAELFRRENVRLCTSWFRYDASHCAIADALKSVNGIMTIYQRACQPDSSPEVAVHTDVAFGYSPLDAEVERRSGSTMAYHVSVGYFGDHRFPLLREPAARLKAELRAQGARYIAAFFDENSREDERWHTGHRFQRENYEFLLEKVLSDPSFGLVLKPKVPSSLRGRLGDSARLLQKALATRRCFLYEEGAVQGIHPPALAALASDVAIHSHLSAATAGMEAALAGTPTLLLDRENWHVSDLYELGVGKVIFQSWPALWSAWREHRRHKGPEGFGDWSPMLNRMDPFRDGCGAERLGTYLLWLLSGLERGGGREAVMAEAAERYCRQWGRDKVTELREEIPIES